MQMEMWLEFDLVDFSAISHVSGAQGFLNNWWYYYHSDPSECFGECSVENRSLYGDASDSTCYLHVRRISYIWLDRGCRYAKYPPAQKLKLKEK